MNTKAVFFLLFFFLVAVNLALVTKINRHSQKEKLVRKIFEEISSKNDGDQFSTVTGPAAPGGYQTEIKLADNRVANLKSFFRKYNSPLFDFAEKIVSISDRYQFDYRLLPAIAMQESNLCRYIPEDSHNCWGWGIYGTTVTRFDDYNDAIETVAKGLKEHYLNKGLVTASTIMEKYTPSSKGSWARGVNTFLRMLE